MGGSSKKTTIGYRYHMGLHFGLCHGPVDAVYEIQAGERTAWSGNQTASGAIVVNAGELFGGDKREGGVAGALDIMMGEPTQGTNSYLVSKLGAIIPAFRGILSAVFRCGQVAANNPYVKPWAFRVKRILKGWTGDVPWYPETAEVGTYLPPSTPLSWATQTHGFGSLSINDVAVSNGYIVAVGQNGKAQRSLDGITWVDSPISVSSAIELRSIAAGTNQLIAVGDTGTIRSSHDGGASWSAVSTSFGAIMWAVASNGPTYIIGYQGGLILRSDGGVTWTQVNTGVGAISFFAVAAGDSKWVVGGDYGVMCISYDAGNSWTVITAKPTTDRIDEILYANNIWIAVSIDGKVISSPDGVTWSIVSVPIDMSAAGLVGLTYGHGKFVVSKDNTMATSTDGVTWASWSISSAGYGLVALETVPNGYVGVGQGKISVALGQAITPVYPNMNPAHIVYQCLTDNAWGMGYPTSSIDDVSFRAAAYTLYSEGFGLSIEWKQQDSIESFIQIVLDHIGGLLYVRPDTGTFALKLIRADYVRAALPVYGPAELIAADNYQRQSWGETINEVSVVYTDHASGKDASITVQDIANVMTQGGVVAQTRHYPGVTLSNLAQRVALRDLQAASTPLAKIRLTATRAVWKVFPGDVFRLNWPAQDISDVVYRVLAVNRGTLENGEIIIDAAEDVFGLPDNTWLAAPVSAWEDPASDPVAATYRSLLETPYWDLARNLSAADLAYVDALAGYLQSVAARPSSDATGYELYARTAAANYTRRGAGVFCPTATISGALTRTTTALNLANMVDLDLVELGGYAVIDSEYVRIDALDAVAGTCTVARAVLDTVPVVHADGARIWFVDGFQGVDQTEAVDGEVVDAKLLAVTGRGALALASAPADSITFDQRQTRPYPPANLKFDGLSWPDVINSTSDVVLTWAHRDRTLQTAYIVAQDEASIGPEAGVTYSVEVADEALTVIYSATGITAATKTVPAVSLTAGLLRWRVWSVRDGLPSWQVHEHWAAWGDVRITEDGEIRITEAGESVILE